MGAKQMKNGKTLEKTMRKLAQKAGVSLKSIKQATTYLRRSVQIVRENHPAQTLALPIGWKTFGDRSEHSRVKRCAATQIRQKLNNATIQSTQNGAEMRGRASEFIALLPRQVLP